MDCTSKMALSLFRGRTDSKVTNRRLPKEVNTCLVGNKKGSENAKENIHGRARSASANEIVAALRQLEGGAAVAKVYRKLRVIKQTFHRWKRKFAGVVAWLSCTACVRSKKRTANSSSW